MTPRTLKMARRRLGLSQAGLAVKLGLHPSTVAQWEQGAKPIGNPVLLQLAISMLEMMDTGGE